jgi:hypothetical protein
MYDFNYIKEQDLTIIRHNYHYFIVTIQYIIMILRNHINNFIRFQFFKFKSLIISYYFKSNLNFHFIR